MFIIIAPINILNSQTKRVCSIKPKLYHYEQKKTAQISGRRRCLWVGRLKNANHIRFAQKGYTPKSIKKFINSVGVAKRDNIIDVSLLEFCVREDLNKIAPRIMAVLNPVKLIITNYQTDKTEF